MKTLLLMKTLPLLVLTLVLVGCYSTSKKLNRVELGMSKAQVIDTIGKPHSVSAELKDGHKIEFLNWNWIPTRYSKIENRLTPYFVRLTDGTVDMFGEKGDFDTVKGRIERKQIEIKHIK